MSWNLSLQDCYYLCIDDKFVSNQCFLLGCHFLGVEGMGGGKRWESVKLTSGNGKLKNVITGQWEWPVH